MSIRSVLRVAAALRETEDQIDTLQGKKAKLQDEIEQINVELLALRDRRTELVAALKVEAGTI